MRLETTNIVVAWKGIGSDAEDEHMYYTSAEVENSVTSRPGRWQWAPAEGCGRWRLGPT